MMVSFQEYQQIKQNFIYFKDFIKKVLLILEGKGGTQIVTSEMVPQTIKLRDVIIPSQDILQGVNYVHAKLQELGTNKDLFGAYLFYFSQYGGSKTQFLNLIDSEIAIAYPNCVRVMFEDFTQIRPDLIFEKMLGQIFRCCANSPQFVQDPTRYKEFIHGLNERIGEIQFALRQSGNLKKAEDLIKDMRGVKNPNVHQALNDLDDLLHSSILVDSIDLLNRTIALMQFCSQYGFLFLFLFDEVDTWLDDSAEDLRFSPQFLQVANFMKRLYEIPNSQVKIAFVFACTDRVNQLLQTFGPQFSALSSAGGRLVWIYNSAEKIPEPGNYGNAIEKTFVKLAAFFSIANDVNVDPKFIAESLAPLRDKYLTITRRTTNSKILEMLRHYQLLYPALEEGLKNWEAETTRYGNLLQDHLTSILRRLNLKFVREDVQIDPTQTLTKDKIDGYFVNYALSGEEKKLFAEIKLTKQFKGDKAYQVLQWLQIHPQDPIVWVLFAPLPLDQVQKEIIKFAESQGFDLHLLEHLHFVHISNPFAFAAINGITKVQADPQKTPEFFEAFAGWFDFFGNVSGQYQKIRQKLGVDIFAPKPPVAIAQVGGGPGPVPPPPPPPPDTSSLTTEENTCVTLLNHMYTVHIFTPSGRISKGKISQLIEEKGLGISDVENVFEAMKRANIILKITAQQVQFASHLLNIQSIQEFNAKIIGMFVQQKKSGVIDKFF